MGAKVGFSMIFGLGLPVKAQCLSFKLISLLLSDFVFPQTFILSVQWHGYGK